MSKTPLLLSDGPSRAWRGARLALAAALLFSGACNGDTTEAPQDGGQPRHDRKVAPAIDVTTDLSEPADVAIDRALASDVAPDQAVALDAIHDARVADVELDHRDAASLADRLMRDFPRIDASADAGPGHACDPRGSQCQAGLVCCQSCCTVPVHFECTPPDPDGTCPAPDVFVDQAALQADVQITEQTFEPEDCVIVEGCVGAPGLRRLLNFSSKTPNIGTADLVLGQATMDNPNFEFSQCHNHYHFVHYARYILRDAAGGEIVTGRKQAFCLEDFEQYDPNAPTFSTFFDCDNQGIHRGWADTYYSGLDCQWLDVTGVPDGQYTLEVEVNPERVFIEKDYSNNVTRVPVTIAPPPPDPTQPCTASVVGEGRDCGWDFNFGGVACTPGTSVSVGCNAAAGCALGSCTGDPMIRVCDGFDSCLFAGALASNDDACTPAGGPTNTCAFVTFTCPDSGNYTLLTGAHDSTQPYSCDIATNPP